MFPNMVLQQVRNTIAVRVIRPRGVDKTELDWVHLGFDDDDEAMTERRLRQGNLIGAAGYISMEDGCVGGFVQRALQYNDDGSGVVMMGGHEAQSQTFRASEAAIRGFWKKYRALTGMLIAMRRLGMDDHRACASRRSGRADRATAYADCIDDDRLEEWPDFFVDAVPLPDHRPRQPPGRAAPRASSIAPRAACCSTG